MSDLDNKPNNVDENSSADAYAAVTLIMLFVVAVTYWVANQ